MSAPECADCSRNEIDRRTIADEVYVRLLRSEECRKSRKALVQALTDYGKSRRGYPQKLIDKRTLKQQETVGQQPSL